MVTCAHCGKPLDDPHPPACTTCWDQGLVGRLDPRMKVLSSNVLDLSRQKRRASQRVYEQKRKAMR